MTFAPASIKRLIKWLTLVVQAPLAGIAARMAAAGGAMPEVRTGMRTGDTTPDQRRSLQRNPPDILITTPESLYLMLTSQARETLRTVETVIVDEVHALAGSKRGAHLALSLERLDDLLEKPAQRIGLSATVRPRDEIARFLGGPHPVRVVASEGRPDSITDSEILEAIRVHTTGKVGMSTLDKVIFLADYIEPNRDFPGVDELRKVAKKDLNKAVLLGFDNTINHLIEQQLSIYPLTILGRNDVLKSCK